VQYQVARVDVALREKLDIPDGLADPRVFVLDPCCGTGAYLVEVLRYIHKFLKDDQGMGALSEHYTKQAAQERVFGFELLPAPFVVAHLQMGLLLQNLAVPLDDSKNERAAIYLTNALTGWEPPLEAAKKQLTFAIPEFRQEKEAADGIKQEKKIIVILGNPPYNGFAGLAVEEERDLSNAYRTTKRAAAPQGQGLNDLYIVRKIPAHCGRTGLACRCPSHARRCWLPPSWAGKSPRCSTRKHPLMASPKASHVRN
jgi:predicted helicase